MEWSREVKTELTALLRSDQTGGIWQVTNRLGSRAHAADYLTASNSPLTDAANFLATGLDKYNCDQ